MRANRLPSSMEKYFLTGLLVLVPAWGTFLILYTLFDTLDGLIADVVGTNATFTFPGSGLVSLLVVIMLTGIGATHILGQQILRWTENTFLRIPLVRTIYHTFKGVTDVITLPDRFGDSPVVVFPFPRDGLWAMGFAMGPAPPPLQIARKDTLIMVFVPTAIHPFTGYLAFIPHTSLHRITLTAEEAMKMEFSAGLYYPRSNWLIPASHEQRRGDWP